MESLSVVVTFARSAVNSKRWGEVHQLPSGAKLAPFFFGQSSFTCLLPRFAWSSDEAMAAMLRRFFSLSCNDSKDRRVLGPPPVCIAHRGGQAERAENTMQAFEYALGECRCDMIELDVHRTRDGEAVVVHDDDLERICGVAKQVSSLDLKDLPPLLPSEELGRGRFEFVGKFGGFAEPFGPQPIASLEEVFKRFPDTWINVDVKGPHDEALLERVVHLTRKYKRQGRTVFAGFNQAKLNRLRELMPEALMSPGPSRIWVYILAYYCGVFSLVHVPEAFFEFPVSFRYLAQDAGEKYEALVSKLGVARLPKFLQALLKAAFQLLARMEAHAVFALLCNPGFIGALRSKGVVCLGWVANSNEEYSDALDRIGCDGVMTDFPSRLRAFLDARSESPEKRASSAQAKASATKAAKAD